MSERLYRAKMNKDELTSMTSLVNIGTDVALSM